jgi:hypothetical protein
MEWEGCVTRMGKKDTNFDLKKSYLYGPTIKEIFNFRKNWKYDELICR